MGILTQTDLFLEAYDLQISLHKISTLDIEKYMRRAELCSMEKYFSVKFFHF